MLGGGVVVDDAFQVRADGVWGSVLQQVVVLLGGPVFWGFEWVVGRSNGGISAACVCWFAVRFLSCLESLTGVLISEASVFVSLVEFGVWSERLVSVCGPGNLERWCMS